MTLLTPEDLLATAIKLEEHSRIIELYLGNLREEVNFQYPPIPDAERDLQEKVEYLLRKMWAEIAEIDPLLAPLRGSFLDRRSQQFFEQYAALHSRVQEWADLDAGQMVKLNRLNQVEHAFKPGPLIDFDDLCSRTREWTYVLEELSKSLRRMGEDLRRADSVVEGRREGQNSLELLDKLRHLEEKGLLESADLPDFAHNELNDLLMAPPSSLPMAKEKKEAAKPEPDDDKPQISVTQSATDGENVVQIGEIYGNIESNRGSRGGLQSGTVQFSAYHRQEITPGGWEPLLAYIFRDSAAAAVIADARKQLGKERSKFSQVTQPSRQDIPEGAPITATPHLDGFQFNPLSVTLGFYDAWHRFDFKMRAKDAPLDKFAAGMITFTVEGVIVADLPISVYVGETVTEAGEPASITRKLYEAVFCSYSHRDTQVVEKVERVCRTLGIDYLRDVTTLKSGQHWDEELLRMIDKADIFQLFWSPSAAESPYVEQEWRHALDLKREDVAFIRPVYWVQPMPDPPQELAHIHFAYHPELAAE